MKTPEKYLHFILKRTGKKESFSPAQRGGEQDTENIQNQEKHGKKLKYQLSALQKEMDTLKESSSSDEIKNGTGLQIKFEGFPDIPLALDKLDRPKPGIELLNVRPGEKNDKPTATVFVPVDELGCLEKLVDEYITGDLTPIKHRRKNQPLIHTIASIQKTTLKDLWTDDLDTFPVSTTNPIWWEVWLRAYSDVKDAHPDVKSVVRKFRELANKLNIKIAEEQLLFPERAVLLVYTTGKKLQNSHALRANIAELRHPKKQRNFLIPKILTRNLNDLKSSRLA